MKYRVVSILLGIFFMMSHAYAVLDLELTQGVDRAIPIAIVPFRSVDHSNLGINVSQIIGKDLHHSGEFKLISTQHMHSSHLERPKLNFNAFREAQADYLVIGDIKPQGNRYRLYFELLDIYKAQYSVLSSSAIVTSREYIVSEKELHKLSHKIADEIYEKLIGEKGIFSSKIAYVVERRTNYRKIRYSLMVADMDGYHAAPILSSNEPIMSPTWSPDGRKIAYVSFEGLKSSIYLSDIVTGQRKLLARFPGVNGAPAFSPDGQKLALVLSKGDSLNIHILDLQTNHVEQVTHGWSIDTEPAWAPDGQSILFTSDRTGSPQIYRLNLSTKQTQRLTYQGRYNACASLTPHGKSIVMMHRDQGQYNIVLQNLETGHIKYLTHSRDNQSPSIAPNGRMVIYTSQEGSREVLQLVSIDGRVKLRLPEKTGSVREPTWQPFQK